MTHDERRDDPTQSTKDYIDLTLKALRAEMRTLFVLSVAGNQLLAHVSFGSAVAAGGLVAGAAAKLAVAYFGR